MKADGLKSLSTGVTRQCGDAHFGHDLKQTFLQCRTIIFGDDDGIGDLQFIAGKQVVERGESGVGIDRRGAITEQAGEVMDIAAFGRFTNKAGLGALFHPDEMMVDGADGQEHRDGRMLRVDLPIAQDKDGGAFFDGLFGLGANAVEMLFESVGAFADGEPALDGAATERLFFESQNLHHFRIGEDGGLEAEQAGVFRRFFEPVAVGAGQDLDRHDELFADRVNRRIGHLGEKLLEVGIENPGLLGEHGQRRVVAHGTDRLFAGFRHGLEDGGNHADLLLGVAGGKLLLDQAGAGRGLGVERRFADDVLDVLAQPGAVGLLFGVDGLDFIVPEQLAGDRVDGDHFPGTEPSLFDDLAVVNGQQAHFGAEREKTVFGDLVAGGAQTVAVKTRADGPAITEDQRGGSIPRLVQRLMIFVKFLHLRGSGSISLPRRRDEHEHGVEQVAPAHDEKFQRVVETGGIAAAGLNDGAQFLDRVAEKGAPEFRFAGRGPEPVSRHGIDLAVVAHHAQRLGKRPGRERIGAVTLMKNRQRGGVIRVAQIEIKPFQGGRGEQPLVNEGAARKARNVEILDPLALGLVLDLVAAEEELPLEFVVAHDGRIGPPHQDLFDVGTGAQRLIAQDRPVDRHHAPAENEELVFGQNDLRDMAAPRLRVGVVGQKHHPDAKIGILEKFVPPLLHFEAEKLVRNLGQEARAVTGFRVGIHRAAMDQRANAGQRLAQDRIGTLPLDAGDETDPAGVVLKGRIIESVKGPGAVKDGLIEGHWHPNLERRDKGTRVI